LAETTTEKESPHATYSTKMLVLFSFSNEKKPT